MTITPGPWETGAPFTEKIGGYHLVGIPISGSGRAIARVWVGTEGEILSTEQAEANARAIAALPTLLRALHMAHNTLFAHGGGPTVKERRDARMVIRAALDKAEPGQPRAPGYWEAIAVDHEKVKDWRGAALAWDQASACTAGHSRAAMYDSHARQCRDRIGQ